MSRKRRRSDTQKLSRDHNEALEDEGVREQIQEQCNRAATSRENSAAVAEAIERYDETTK